MAMNFRRFLIFACGAAWAGAAARADTGDYARIQGRLARGWNTWDTRSVLTQVHLPDGAWFAPEFRVGGERLRSAQPCDRNPEGVRVAMGMHALDGRYSELTLSWRGLTVRVETAAEGDRCVMLITPVEGARAATVRFLTPAGDPRGELSLAAPVRFAVNTGSALGWDTIYDAAHRRVITPVRPAGFVPNYASGRLPRSLDRSEPPVGSLVVERLYRRFHDRWFVAEAFPGLLAWNRWWAGHRAVDGYLVWGSDPSDPDYDRRDGAVNTLQGAKYESGLDNSPLYDAAAFDPRTHHMLLADVGLMSLYVADCDALADLADVLGRQAEAAELRRRSAAFSAKLATLWDDRRGLYLNRDLRTGLASERIAPTNFYPLLTGVPTPAQARRMIGEHLFNPAEFWGQWVLPATPRNDPAFRDQWYWRGRIWGPMNLLVYWGLERHGTPEERRALARKSEALLLQGWLRRGQIHENYNCVTGDGDDVSSSDPFYSWGALLGVLGWDRRPARTGPSLGQQPAAAQPRFQQRGPRIQRGIAQAQSRPMSAMPVDVELGRHAGLDQRAVKVDGGRNRARSVVRGGIDEGRGRLPRDMQGGSIAPGQFRALCRRHMHEGGVRRDIGLGRIGQHGAQPGVAEDEVIGPAVLPVDRIRRGAARPAGDARHGRQVAAGRKAHHADAVGPQAEFGRVGAHPADGALGVLQRHGIKVPGAEPIGEDKRRNAPDREPVGHLAALEILRQVEVGAARSDDDRGAVLRVRLRPKHRHGRNVLGPLADGAWSRAVPQPVSGDAKIRRQRVGGHGGRDRLRTQGGGGGGRQNEQEGAPHAPVRFRLPLARSILR
ncbi:MAG TPA: trehalase family glycosidase [Opitutaceae bacterium]|jgi:hypothetical protein|nr:trehalase family glycosidase [Opitutaceae bacterium]